MLPYFKQQFTGGLHSYNRLATVFKFYNDRLDTLLKQLQPSEVQEYFKNISVKEIIAELSDLEELNETYYFHFDD